MAGHHIGKASRLMGLLLALLAYQSAKLITSPDIYSPSIRLSVCLFGGIGQIETIGLGFYTCSQKFAPTTLRTAVKLRNKPRKLG